MILVVTNLVTLSTYEGTCLPLVRVIYRVSICSSFGVIGDKIHELVVLLCNTYLTKGVCKKPSTTKKVGSEELPGIPQPNKIAGHARNAGESTVCSVLPDGQPAW